MTCFWTDFVGCEDTSCTVAVPYVYSPLFVNYIGGPGAPYSFYLDAAFTQPAVPCTDPDPADDGTCNVTYAPGDTSFSNPIYCGPYSGEITISNVAVYTTSPSPPPRACMSPAYTLVGVVGTLPSQFNVTGGNGVTSGNVLYTFTKQLDTAVDSVVVSSPSALQPLISPAVTYDGTNYTVAGIESSYVIAVFDFSSPVGYGRIVWSPTSEFPCPF